MKILKTLFFILILTWSKLIFAQFPIDKESGAVKYTEVVELSGMNKKEIYDKAKFWIVSTLKSGDNMVELDGSSSDKIVGTGNLILNKLPRGTASGKEYFSTSALNFKFIVLIKEGKLKYSIENFTLRVGSGLGMQLIGLENLEYEEKYYSNKKQIEQRFVINATTYIDELIKDIVQDFITSMKKVEEDDW